MKRTADRRVMRVLKSVPSRLIDCSAEGSYFMEHAGQGLENIVAGSLRRAPQSEAPLLAWPLVCGSAVADRTRVVDFVSGVLRVEVSDPGWKRELQSLAPRYLATLNRYIGQTVKRIEFVIRQA